MNARSNRNWLRPNVLLPSIVLLATVGLVLVSLGSARVSPRNGATASTRSATLTAPKAAVLGVVEGVTEYLPVSSTGHLLITERIIDVGQRADEKAATDTYTVVIQLGAILAVLGIFRRRFALMIHGILGRSEEGRNLVRSLALAFLPAVVLALGLQGPIKDRLLQPWPVVGAWLVGGVVILLFSWRRSQFRTKFTSLSSIPWQVAVGIGLAQALSLWPGTSRSLVTILAALALGVSLTVAVEFSFLLGFLTLSAATGYELLKDGSTLIDRFGIVNPLIGIAVAGAAAFISVKWMVTYLERHPMTVFGWYRIGIGAVVAVLLATRAI